VQHNIALSPEREKEAEQTLKMVFDLAFGEGAEGDRVLASG
jgi:hypothetical protein